MNLTRYLLDNGALDEKPALAALEGELSYETLRRSSAQAARFLLERGAGKGDRALLLSDSNGFWAASYLGTIMAGCVSVPLPVNVDPGQFSYVLEKTRPRFVLIQGRHFPRYGPLVPEGVSILVDGPRALGDKARFPFSFFGDLRDTDPARPEECPAIDEKRDLAALMFTSGSTGEPRGVMVTHGNIMANTESIIRYIGLGGGDRMMSVLPFYYCFGTSLLHTHLRVGGTVVCDGRFMYPNKVLERMVQEKCTGFAGVPSTYMILLRSSAMKKMRFPDLRHVQQAGGKLPSALITELRETLPGVKVFIMYGQTEATARLSYLPPEMLDAKLGSIGRGIPGVRLEVVGEDGRPAAPGAVGEIVAQGDNVAPGYWEEPGESAKVFRDGKLHTGDLAVADEEGFITIVDRAKDFLKCGGVRASSREIEDAVFDFEGVVEAAVIGSPDDVLGEAVHLFVVHARGEEAGEDLLRHCGRRLPLQLVPRKIVFLKRLPKNSSGKVDKVALKRDPRYQGDPQ